jgi:hypothetical protein
LELSFPWVDFALAFLGAELVVAADGCGWGAAAGFDFALLNCSENPLLVGWEIEISAVGAGGIGAGFGKMGGMEVFMV